VPRGSRCLAASFAGRQTDAQRGEASSTTRSRHCGAFTSSGTAWTDPTVLNLVTNPVALFLPAPQQALEADWKRELAGATASRSTGSTRSTTCRSAGTCSTLIDSGNLQGYMERLVNAFNPAAVEGTDACRSHDLGWLGCRLYDCDFNQMT